jgi:hypothetical protein
MRKMHPAYGRGRHRRSDRGCANFRNIPSRYFVVFTSLVFSVLFDSGRLERGDWHGGSRIDNNRKLTEALDVEPCDLLAN